MDADEPRAAWVGCVAGEGARGRRGLLGRGGQLALAEVERGADRGPQGDGSSKESRKDVVPNKGDPEDAPYCKLFCRLFLA